MAPLERERPLGGPGRPWSATPTRWAVAVAALGALVLVCAALVVLVWRPGRPARSMGPVAERGSLWGSISSVSALLGLGRPPSPWNSPITESWPVVTQWTPRLEDEYAQFVERLGRAVAERRCARLDRCLRDPAANLLFDPQTDPELSLEVDCGDLPYVLRGYFSFKRRLPFGFVCEITGTGGTGGTGGDDVRYLSDVTPTRYCSWQQYKTPRAVLREMGWLVHSGMFRMAPEVEGADYYPIAVTRAAVRPGTVYYDPNGHVLTVAAVAADGTVQLIDGHPDGSLTWKRFGQAFALGGRSQGGGFKNFRPLRLVDGELVRAPNQELPLFDGQSQWNSKLWASSGPPGTYYSWVRQSLASGQGPGPVADFRAQVAALCRDISDRVDAVQASVDAGLPSQPHPAELPWNIYGTSGDWEMQASPSRDARLKAAVRELYGLVAGLPAGSPLLLELHQAWQTESAQPACQFTYRSSAGTSVPLPVDAVLSRLFLLSFDPYHCPELRWGAAIHSPEGATCPEDSDKLDWYDKEQRLRNRIDRDYGAPTPISEGPEEPPVVDFRRLFPAEGAAIPRAM